LPPFRPHAPPPLQPEGINKLSVFIKSKPAVFKVDDKAGTVSLLG
jgi:hypothetical protein